MDAHKHADSRLVEVDYFSFYGSSNISEVAQKLQRNFVSSLEVMVATKSDPNCVEPACADKMEFFKTAVSKKTSKRAAHPTPAKDCPLDRQELGNATWGLLHSMGIYYPDKPSPEYQAKAKTFIEALALMYPCVDCANDFQKEIVKSPPRVESRTSFSMWLCEQHNIVNRKIHKPMFKCTMENLEERWRKGKPSCWGEDGDEDSTQDTLV